MKRKQLTRDDIARMAGVGAGTVSRVYNHPETVSKDKVKRVLRAAKKAGYSPNRAASALRRERTGVILLLEIAGERRMPDKRFYAWHYAEILDAVRSVTDEHGYLISLHSVSSEKDMREIGKKRLCDAVIGYEITRRPTAERVRGLGLPYVCCGRTIGIDGINRCYIDEIHGGSLAGERLRRSGHTRPAHITSGLGRMRVSRHRWEGFQEGFAGRPVRLIEADALGIDGGYGAGEKVVPLIERDEIDCIFVVNDLTAVGVVYALLNHGIRIPEDVSLVGYDNLPFVETLPIRLSTVDINMGKVYEEAARRLIESIEAPRPIEASIKPFFVEGETIVERK